MRPSWSSHPVTSSSIRVSTERADACLLAGSPARSGSRSARRSPRTWSTSSPTDLNCWRVLHDPWHTRGMGNRVRVTVESADRKVFVSALDWPGWSRSGKTEDLAVEAFLAAAPRYAVVAKQAGLDFDARVEVDEAEREDGEPRRRSGCRRDRRRGPATGRCRRGGAAGGDRQAAWTVFDRVAAAAPEELRRVPRGRPGPDQGRGPRQRRRRRLRDRDGHQGARRGRAPGRDARRPAPAVGRIADRRPQWPPRYAARRITWHALNHAWEIEDRTD